MPYTFKIFNFNLLTLWRTSVAIWSACYLFRQRQYKQINESTNWQRTLASKTWHYALTIYGNTNFNFLKDGYLRVLLTYKVKSRTKYKVRLPWNCKYNQKCQNEQTVWQRTSPLYPKPNILQHQKYSVNKAKRAAVKVEHLQIKRKHWFFFCL